MGCNCGKPKCDGHCNASPAVLQINNPSECVLFHKVEIPASMGNEITIPPDPGLYKNVLLYYEATGNAYFYSSDGIPTPISYTDYTRLTNKPSINGVMLVGNKTLDDLGININDATLTVKQGETTLGTFSANASENVEINIPGTGDGPTSFTVSYDTTVSPWTDTDAGLLFYERGMFDGPFTTICERIQTFAVPEATFTNDKTGDVLNAEGLYNLLETGANVVLNGVPVGMRLKRSNSTTTFTTGNITCDGVKLNKVGPYHDEGHDPDTGDLVYSMDMTTYAATVSANPIDLTFMGPSMLVPLVVRAYKKVTLDTEISSDPQTEYGFEVQGTYRYSYTGPS